MDFLRRSRRIQDRGLRGLREGGAERWMDLGEGEDLEEVVAHIPKGDPKKM